MKRSHAQACRLLADALEDPNTVDWIGTAKRCLVLLAPPKKKIRKRDPVKSARKVTVKELDKLCRAIVFARDGNKCRRCGKETHLQWSHVYTRGIEAIRWDLDNSKVLCAGCHNFWWHKRPVDAAAWWESEIGRARMSSLALRASMKGRGKPNYVAILKDLEAEAKRLGVKI